VPDPDLTKCATSVLLLTKFKPAGCKGNGPPHAVPAVVRAEREVMAWMRPVEAREL
jgi:hypothetical protein